MKFSSAIAFVIVNLAATATAVALPQTLVFPTTLAARQATQTGGGNQPPAQTQNGGGERPPAQTQNGQGGGNRPATQTQMVARTAIAERQAGESPWIIINQRNDAAPADVPSTLLKVLRSQGVTVIVPSEPKQTGSIAARQQGGESGVDAVVNAVPVGGGQNGAPIEARQSGRPRVSARDAPGGLEARQTSEPIPIGARQVGPLLEARQSGMPRFTVRDTEDNLVARQTAAPVPIIEEGPRLEARQSQRPRISARDTEDNLMARQTAEPVPIGARQVGPLLEARQSGMPRFTVRDTEDNLVARQTAAPVPVIEDGPRLEARQSQRPRISARDTEDNLVARQTAAPVPIGARQAGETRPLPTVGPVKARQEDDFPTDPVPTAAVIARQGGDTPAQRKGGDDSITF